MSDNFTSDQLPLCPGGIIYTIKAGDTFYTIAKTYNIDVYAVIKANPNVDPNKLQVGQQICVPAVSPAPCPGGIMYTIKAGDTFYSIAKFYKVDVYAVIKANPNVDPNKLQVGQQICVPAVGPAPTCPSGKTYTIVAGDTYSSIARRFSTTVAALIAANPGVNPDNLQIGQLICIPSVSNAVVYRNIQYGFNFTLPLSWKGYSIVSGSWVGNDVASGQIIATGPIISIRHPLWTAQNPRQDIPIMVFTISQWNALQQGKFHIGAAPIGPTELGRNSSYVFALPARYNYAFPTGYEEVERILQGHPLQAT